MTAALSLRPVWAWLVIRPDVTDPAARAKLYELGQIKVIENRGWPTSYRGELLIHAGKKLTVDDYDAALLFIEAFICPSLAAIVPDIGELQAGGLVGRVNLVNCVQAHPSPWFTGGSAIPSPRTVDDAHGTGYGFVLENARPMPFVPYKGMQRFFNVRLP
ncbi:hypothetical protein [Rhodoferax sp.]|uniref:hypothetical protein n=1 Tax=Rhodoferax sp. TaxID=50421 RepID=UPI0027711BF2|nr:hypothetical protein [Rhodoferax sp.]